MKLLTEFVGSFLFMLVIAMAVVLIGPFAPLAIGAALMTMVYMGRHISGAHYNPAVSLAVLLRGKITLQDFVGYVVAQLLGSFAAFYLGYWLTGSTPGLSVPDEMIVKAFVIELVFTFMLALTVLNVATSSKTAGNSYYGLAIGFVIVVAAFVGGPISGGAYNPAVGAGATAVKAIVDAGDWSGVWLYLAGPFLGGILAAVVFRLQGGQVEEAPTA
ncbi:MAG TPA: aquaporin [Fimbriimonadaceae bacterium]|nr:aquaporin [Fimbriimonadaceae bacterium]HRJ95338.1 aquaporin [Fimbriimonadaceae bacterium]